MVHTVSQWASSIVRYGKGIHGKGIVESGKFCHELTSAMEKGTMEKEYIQMVGLFHRASRIYPCTRHLNFVEYIHMDHKLVYGKGPL